MKKGQQQCHNCIIKFKVKHESKEAISYCPFCGEEQEITADEAYNEDLDFEDGEDTDEEM